MRIGFLASLVVSLTCVAGTSNGQQESEQSANSSGGSKSAVIVTVRNRAPELGTFLTPIWVGFHDASFDIYDRGAPANALPIAGSDALERLAEDGNTGPISSDFSSFVGDGVQTTITSNNPSLPPLGPQARSSRLFRVDATTNRYFSYASMVIPSNDAFVANGSPTAHPVFDSNGQFVAEAFTVLGSDVLDAGTEVNDEMPSTTAFFGQAAPNTGTAEGGTILAHPGFDPPGSGGILDGPMFANADFLLSGYEVLEVTFKELDLALPHTFLGFLTAGQEVTPPNVSGFPFGFGTVRSESDNSEISYLIYASGLSGNTVAAHLHAAPVGENGPIVVDLLASGSSFSFFGTTFLFGSIDQSEVVGPLGNTSAPLDDLLAELATAGIYINLHTAANPAGEVRGQLFHAN